jgi:hypothetical protein
MLKEPAFWVAAASALVLLFIFSHPIIWVPLVIVLLVGLYARRQERAELRAKENWEEHSNGVRSRWLSRDQSKRS